jgi:hypothetical protein
MNRGLTAKGSCLLPVLMFCSLFVVAQQKAPAYPLITHDPYFSIWSFGDTLNKTVTQHWTGTDHSLTGILKVDGIRYRFLGKETKPFNNVAATSDEESYTVKFTEEKPSDDWMQPAYNDVAWKSGKAPFGRNARAETRWASKDLWVRRSFSLEKTNWNQLFLKINHDDNTEVYLNGEKIYSRVGWLNKFQLFPIDKAIQSKLKKGNNVLAIHVANTAGGQWLDAGIVEEGIVGESSSITEAVQKNCTLNATQTVYDFTCGSVDLTLTFTSPLLMNDPDLLSRPVSYISFKARSNDGKPHDVQLLFAASTDIATNTPGQEIITQKINPGSLIGLKAGTTSQPVLQKRGDDLRIDWGYLYVALPKSSNASQFVSAASQAWADRSFSRKPVGTSDTTGKHLSLNTVIAFGKLGTVPSEQIILLAYDDLYSVQYFRQNLRPWWNRDSSKNILSELLAASRDYKKILGRCEAFNRQLHADAVAVGGEEYAKLCELAYRQSIAAHKLVRSPNGDLLFLSKENYSNGSINTVDVTYPSAPLFLIYNPGLLKGMLNGIFLLQRKR